MKKVLLASVGALAFVVPTPALANQSHAPTPRHRGVYMYLRRHVIKQFGVSAAGRNIVRDGLSTGKPVTDAVMVSSIRVYQRTLWPYVPPPAPAPVAEPTSSYSAPQAPAQAPTATTSSYSGGYSIPSYIVQCESGGNWSAVNASSGAGGAYQILPSTWQAYGGQGLPQDASPAEQSRIAAEIYAASGPSQWSCG